ncbi:hypothetical protein Asi02nite_77300 [Asanoa siamensis]|uniref:Uncharacterized protein n=1 Tax=Asanoa siamensis TaxID=926357 RepID=A0ABQ4D3V2_9ACTN|nr:hypothetical protein Asi02nite_77300 [Asanoa siamensis]
MAGPACYEPPAASGGVPFAPIDDRWNRLTDEPHIQKALTTNYHGLKAKRTAIKVVHRTRRHIAAALDDIIAAVPARTDVVVHHTPLPGEHLAEALGVPAVPVSAADLGSDQRLRARCRRRRGCPDPSTV